jgi:hypothetical protein
MLKRTKEVRHMWKNDGCCDDGCCEAAGGACC